MGDDYKLAFELRFSDFEGCWDDQGFHPQRAPHVRERDLVAYATFSCYDFFISNGLWGLWECEWGKMFPEMVAGCNYLGAAESAAVCRHVERIYFPEGFPRNDRDRAALISTPELIAEIHDYHSDALDRALEKDQFRDRAHCFRRLRCGQLGLEPAKVIYDLRIETRPEWEWLWESEIP
jgi:hypothetical protein